MKEQRSDKMRLLDIRNKADRILRKYAELSGEQLDDDDLRYDGFVRLVSIIGEAAYKLSRELRAAHPEIPWRPIIAMRHIIVHDYDEVDEKQIWGVIKNHLPILRQQVQAIIDTLPE